MIAWGVFTVCSSCQNAVALEMLTCLDMYVSLFSDWQYTFGCPLMVVLLLLVL